MTGRVKTDLAGRINQYVNYRRRVEKSGDSFSQALSRKVGEDKAAMVKAEPARHARRSASRAGARSGGRGVRAAQGSAGGRSWYPKHITKVQAMRLANYAPVIQQASGKYGVPVELICAVILQESGGNMKAVSHCGARGLMQLMPATARRLGVANSHDPVQNIMGGTKYLRMLMDRFGGNVALALAGYNAGEGNVEKYGRRIPPFKETQAYVPNVLKYADTLWRVLRSPVKRIAVRPAIHHRTIYSVSRKA